MRRLPLHVALWLIGMLGWFSSGNSALAQESGAAVQPRTGLLHVGLWVTDIDEMLSFLTAVSDFKKLSESERKSGGKRIFLGDARGQQLELLVAPDVQEHPPFALHPVGRTAGIAHIAIRVANTLELKKRLHALGYEILLQVPATDDQGYVESEYGEHRILFVEGPSGVTFELFEFRHENNLETGRQIY